MKKTSLIIILLAILMTVCACNIDSGDEITSIALTGEMKTEYVLGESKTLDFGTLGITLFSSKGERTIAVTSDMISGDYNLASPGEYTITVNYEDSSFPIEIRVIEPKVQSIGLTFPLGYVAEFYEGDIPNFSGIKLTVTYVNGYSVDWPVTSEMFTGLDMITLGDHTAVLHYGEMETEFTYTVSELKIKSSEILTEDFISVFTVYDEPIISGLKIRINFEDERIPEFSRSIVYDVTLDMISGLDVSSAGEKECVVTFRGCVHKVSYTVVDLPPAANENDFTYEIDDWGGYSIAIKEGVNLKGNVILPRRHNDLFITSIKEDGFIGCDVESIELFKTIKAIGRNAFADCYYLENINLENVKFIGEGAFENCKSLKSLDLSLITSLSPAAFADCVSVNEITFGDNLVSIGDRAFYNLNSLTGEYNFDALREVGENAFAYCSLIEKVSFVALYSLGASAFAHCSNLSEITLPETLEVIGDGAFAHCSNLSDISLPTGVEYFGTSVFSACSSLTTVELPELLLLPALTFDGCSSLKTVVLANTLTEIGAFAFKDCSLLQELIIPENCKSVGNAAFEGCRALSRIVIPAGCTLSSSVFMGWTSAQTVELQVTSQEAEATFDEMWKLGCDAVIIYKN